MKIENSPFLKYRHIMLQKHGGAKILRNATLSMWDGKIHPFDISSVGFLDDNFESIFKQLLAHYLIHGENDDDFMSVARECWDLK